MPVPDVHTILNTGSKSSVSGIVESRLTGDRLVPESRRADGSVRKERRIKPGYVPPEEIEKFKSARQLDAERTARPKGVVPGMSASAIAQAVASANAAGKAGKKPPKRTDPRDEAAITPPLSSGHAPPDAWDAEDPVEPEKASPPPEEPKEVDPEKRSKQLNKKLRQAEALRDRKAAGESLLPEQEEKVASIASLEEQLAKFSL